MAKIKHVPEVFWRFFVLGFIGFGGPAAHIALFQKEFVQRLRWLSDNDYAQIVALSQFLPGPGSSQVGFTLGLRKAGILGGCAAFIGFTLPSFVILLALAYSGLQHSPSDWVEGIIHGLKILALVVVLDATLSMFGSFCKNGLTRGVAVATAIALLLFPATWVQLLALALAGALCLLVLPNKATSETASSRANFGWLPMCAFILLFIGLPYFAKQSDLLHIFKDFYHTGSLVFGGGHVVLPLLQQATAESLEPEVFLSGYAAAQAIPGPMFTLATYLGAELTPYSPAVGAAVATIAIFLPGFLLILAIYPAWQQLSHNAYAINLSMGVNAAVVGLLMAALYQPVFTSAIVETADLAIALIGFFALRQLKLPIVLLVVLMAVLGTASTVYW